MERLEALFPRLRGVASRVTSPERAVSPSVSRRRRPKERLQTPFVVYFASPGPFSFSRPKSSSVIAAANGAWRREEAFASTTRRSRPLRRPE